MARFPLCQSLRKKKGARRLALDFEPCQLLESVNVTSCVPCSLILEGIVSFEDATWSFREHVAHVYGYGLERSRDTLSLDLLFIDERPKLTIEFFHQNDHFHDPCWAVKSRPSISGDPLGSDSMKWVISLLDCCLRNHKGCSSTKQVELPHRLLVLDDSSQGSTTIRLEENEIKLGCYATLSHCWGSQQRCTTTRENLEERKLGIPWNEIPKTFQDSITYCLKLGIRYLWIDALCIIQNDNQDWEVESSKMADIYQNSFITLAAASAQSDSGGCFMETPVFNLEHKLSLLEELGPIFVREKLHHWESPQTKASMQRDPLLTRGWVFQERILSPRVVYFCSQELVWECTSSIQCECGGVDPRAGTKSHFAQVLGGHGGAESRAHTDLYYRVSRIVYPELFQRLYTQPDEAYEYDLDSDSDDPDSRFNDLLSLRRLPPVSMEARVFLEKWWLNLKASEIWHRIVEEYSSLQLTKSADRLPALSGLAVRNAGSSRLYMAGLWKETIATDILWRVDQLQLSSRRSVEREPSWSWVSVNSRVKYWNIEEVIGNVSHQAISATSTRPLEKAKVSQNPQTITCTVKAKGENEFGEVQSGMMVTTGYLRIAILNYMDDWIKNSGRDMRKQHNSLLYRLSIGQLFLPFFADYILSGEGDDNVPDRAILFLLQVFPNICLVLKYTGKAHDFVRIGIFKFTTDFERTYGTDIMREAVKQLVIIH